MCPFKIFSLSLLRTTFNKVLGTKDFINRHFRSFSQVMQHFQVQSDPQSVRLFSLYIYTDRLSLLGELVMLLNIILLSEISRLSNHSPNQSSLSPKICQFVHIYICRPFKFLYIINGFDNSFDLSFCRGGSWRYFPLSSSAVALVIKTFNDQLFLGSLEVQQFMLMLEKLCHISF